MKRSLQLNPELKPATWEDIKLKREELKRSPITVNVGTFDVDDISFLNITTAISSFSAIADPVTVTVPWKLEDNTVILVSEADLITVRDAVAVRASTIHTVAEVINAGSYLVKDLGELTLWGIN